MCPTEPTPTALKAMSRIAKRSSSRSRSGVRPCGRWRDTIGAQACASCRPPGAEMKDGRRLVDDLGPVAPDQMREIVVLGQAFAARLGDDPASLRRRRPADPGDLLLEVDPAVPDLQGRQPGQHSHVHADRLARCAAARARACFFGAPPSASAATATLAARRFRSTVKSTPGSVSSKSLTSNRCCFPA